MRRMWSKNQLLKGVETEAKENGIQVFEDVIDKDGHKRFIEGDITIEAIEGVAQTYGKWSLSGSHLLIVIAGNIDNATTLSSNTLLAELSIPQWIIDKIYPTYATIVDYKTFSLNNSVGASQSMPAFLQKITGNELQVRTGSITTTDNRFYRFNFDLLIDDE